MVKKKLSKREIEKKVGVLVKKFEDLQEEYIGKSTKILFDIVDLRRIKKADYGLSDLVQEKGLEKYSDIIEGIWSYKNLEPCVVELQAKGKISNSQAMFMAHLPKKLLTPKNQKKIAEKIVKGEITDKDLSQKGNWNIFTKIKENPMDEYKTLLLEVIYQTKGLSERILKHKKELKVLLSKKDKAKLKENFYFLKNAIQFGLGIKLK